MKPCPLQQLMSYSNDSQNVDLRPSALALPRNLLEMQSFRLYPRPTLSETAMVGPRNLCFNKKPTRKS